ncbi:MAG: OmpA family protein [Deltaproteobacteria bacterium]|nr:OmpA family protein [Deltaproteobacteria bacterium]
MKVWQIVIVVILAINLFLPVPCPCQENTFEVDESAIPPEAQQKATEALQALGSGRGALPINYRMVRIIGLAKAIETQTTEIKTALKDVGAKETETEIHVDLRGDVLFDFDKCNIRPEAMEPLRKIGEIIKAYNSPHVIISGHTDTKGAEDYNRRLSEKRAETVKAWFAECAGIDPRVMETKGYGETKPIAPNSNPDGSDNPEGRQKNRRVEIRIRKS